MEIETFRQQLLDDAHDKERLLLRLGYTAACGRAWLLVQESRAILSAPVLDWEALTRAAELQCLASSLWAPGPTPRGPVH